MVPVTFFLQLAVGSLALKTVEFRSDPRHVAVCVTGLPSRLQPFSLLSGLHNANPDFSFHTFYVLQNAEEQYYSSSPEKIDGKSDVSTYAGLDQHAIRQLLEEFAGINRTTVAFMKPQTMEDWQQELHTNGYLNVIWQYDNINDKILNMYEHHVRCAELIVAKEAEIGIPFDYIISAREDAFLFHPLDLHALFAKFFKEQSCDIVTKDCLAWGGINMRLQILRREKGAKLLASRLAAYKTLLNSGAKVQNPERFEQKQIQEMHLKSCSASISELPVSISRIKKNMSSTDPISVPLNGAPSTLEPFCFIVEEVRDINNSTDHCIPLDNASFVDAHMC